jgi:hypothetical protein
MSLLILLTSLVFAIISVPFTGYKESKVKTISVLLGTFILFTGLQLIGKYLFLTHQIFEAKLFTFIVFGLIAQGINHMFNGGLDYKEDGINLIGRFIPTILIILTIVLSIVYLGYNLNNSTNKHQTLKTVEKEEMPAFDEKSKPISVPLVFAENKMKKSFGQVPNSSYYELGKTEIQKLNDKIVYVTPIEFSGYFKWKKEKVTPGYFVVSATDSSENPKFVKKQMTYTDSAYFGNNASRKIYLNDPKTVFKGEGQFEVDEEGNPYIFKTYGEYIKNFGRVGFKPKGIVLLNTVTGKVEKLTLKSVPKWLEAPVSSKIASYQNDVFGTLENGFLNSLFAKKDVILPNDNGNENGTTPIFIDDKMYYFSDFTSPKSGIDSMMGYTLTDSRTAEITFYSGKEETSLMDTEGAIEVANKKFVEKEWESSIPILYNINGEPTWYVSITDSNGFLQQIAIVSAENTEFFVSSASAADAMKKYKALIAGKISGDVSVDSEADKKKEMIEVSRVYKERSGDLTTVYVLDKTGRTFILTTEIDQKVLFIQENDQIEVEYLSVENKKIFNVLSITTKF